MIKSSVGKERVDPTEGTARTFSKCLNLLGFYFRTPKTLPNTVLESHMLVLFWVGHFVTRFSEFARKPQDFVVFMLKIC